MDSALLDPAVSVSAAQVLREEALALRSQLSALIVDQQAPLVRVGSCTPSCIAVHHV